MAPLGDFGPAPGGIHLQDSQTTSVVAWAVSMGVLGTLAVATRIAARLIRSGAGLAVDDFFIVAALVFALATVALCLTSIPFGGGKHLWSLTFDDFNKLWQTTYAFVLIYATCVSLTKASILLFYRRIFGASWAYKICMGLVGGYWISIAIAWLSGCRPASYFWKQFTDPTAKGYCMDTSLFYFVNGICAMLIDVCILLVPMPTIYKLQMPPGQKLIVCGILLLGSFVCVASMVRIVMMNRLVKAQDFTWAMAQVFIWSCCEPFIGILCACLPTYAPLLQRWWKTDGASRKKTSGLTQNSSGSYDTPRRTWGRLHESDSKIRNDDEVELTTDIRAGVGSNMGSVVVGDDDPVLVQGPIAFAASVQIPEHTAQQLAREEKLEEIVSKKVDWRDFSDAISLFDLNSQKTRRLFDDRSKDYNAITELRPLGAKILVDELSNTFLKAADQSLFESTKTLEALVSTLSTFETTDPRDTIYAFVNIARDTYSESASRISPAEMEVPPPTPVHTKDLLVVYTDFVRYVIASSKSLDIICRQWALTERKTKTVMYDQLVELPSWIKTNGDSFVGLPNARCYNASRSKEPVVRFGMVPESEGVPGSSLLNGIDEGTQRTATNPTHSRDNSPSNESQAMQPGP
ncbi:Uu.00g032500.m01.CDS01 [Anthostomella pinea]|uniref:Uu.00g032500.m01.CDS01 n=1 Tax=Anthostomella pinea TaxID=933095 RepID=A0AAI8V9A9_9PEZI|nr:Uu.00g032500.m01.CDS01 [Anthostomella pinea]